MATPILEQVSKDLAYKLQDPVAGGTVDGLRVTADERLSYITRAYRRLLRLVTMLYPELIENLFSGYYVIDEVSSDNSGQISAAPYAEVHEVYCKEPSDERFTKAVAITANNHLSVAAGENAFYKPDINKKQYYWSLIGDYVTILPPVTYQAKLLNRKNTASLIETGGYGGTYDINVPTEHIDLLLSLAAAEGYLDIGQADMVNAYKQDVSEQLSILAQVNKKNEQQDTTNEV
jgi:hypothetical protein